LDKGILQVDTIAGGMIKIVNAKIVNEFNVLPESKLFFGFEELDYDFRIKKLHLVLLVDKELYLRHRKFHNKIGIDNVNFKKNKRNLVRDYYSSRNLLFILKSNNLKKALCFTLLRIIYKCITAFRFGLGYGLDNLKYQIKAIYHYTINCYGPIK
jgi:hypothetical protein